MKISKFRGVVCLSIKITHDCMPHLISFAPVTAVEKVVGKLNALIVLKIAILISTS